MSKPNAVKQESDDLAFMGTREEAEQGLLAAWRTWTPLAQPLMAPAKEHCRRESLEREARNRLAQAGSLLAWHLDRGEAAS